MVETLEHLIRRLVERPRTARGPLFKELLRSETFLLTVDEPLSEEQVTRTAGPNDSFPVWADKDRELGGLWVPVFPARDTVAEFVKARGLQAPHGKEFLWMEHQPRAVFGLLRGVPCFAGLRLTLDDGSAVELSRQEVAALAEGKIPSDAPTRYELPIPRLTVPAGLKLSFGRFAGERLLVAPDAGHFTPGDLRRLVRLPIGGEPAWTPCRHFLQLLRLLHGLRGEGPERYVDELLGTLFGFEMYGEAEALCLWLAAKGRESFSWLGLALVYAKTGRHSECAELCARGEKKYPSERAFPLHGARAYCSLGKKDQARATLSAALKRFPGDARLRSCLDELMAGLSI